MIEELRILPDNQRVSRATVFRVLRDLETLGLVRILPTDS